MNISGALSGICLVFILLGFLLGTGRGFARALLRFIVVCATAVITYFLVNPISRGLVNADLSNLNVSVLGNPLTTVNETLVSILQGIPAVGDLMAVSPTFTDLIKAVPVVFLNVILMIVLFFIFKLFTMILYKLLDKMILPERKKKEKPKKQLLGGLIGAVQGFICFAVVLIPMFGLVNLSDKVMAQINTVNSSLQNASFDTTSSPVVYAEDRGGDVIYINADQENEGDDVGNKLKEIDGKYVELIKDMFVFKAYKAVGLADLATVTFEGLTTMNIKNDRVSLTNEIENAAKGYEIYNNLKGVSFKDLTENDIKNIKGIINTLFDSRLIGNIVEEIIPSAAEAWLDPASDTFLGIAKPDVGKDFNDVFDALLEELKDGTKTTIKGDLIAIVNTLDVCRKYGIVSVSVNGDNESVLNIMGTDGFMTDLIREITKSNTLKNIFPELINVGVKFVYPVFELSSNREEVVDDLIEGICNEIKIWGEDTTFVTYRDKTKENIKKLFKDAEITLIFKEGDAVINEEKFDIYIDKLVPDTRLAGAAVTKESILNFFPAVNFTKAVRDQVILYDGTNLTVIRTSIKDVFEAYGSEVTPADDYISNLITYMWANYSSNMSAVSTEDIKEYFETYDDAGKEYNREIIIKDFTIADILSLCVKVTQNELRVTKTSSDVTNWDAEAIALGGIFSNLTVALNSLDDNKAGGTLVGESDLVVLNFAALGRAFNSVKDSVLLHDLGLSFIRAFLNSKLTENILIPAEFKNKLTNAEEYETINFETTFISLKGAISVLSTLNEVGGTLSEDTVVELLGSLNETTAEILKEAITDELLGSTNMDEDLSQAVSTILGEILDSIINDLSGGGGELPTDENGNIDVNAIDQGAEAAAIQSVITVVSGMNNSGTKTTFADQAEADAFIANIMNSTFIKLTMLNTYNNYDVGTDPTDYIAANPLKILNSIDSGVSTSYFGIACQNYYNNAPTSGKPVIAPQLEKIAMLFGIPVEITE